MRVVVCVVQDPRDGAAQLHRVCDRHLLKVDVDENSDEASLNVGHGEGEKGEERGGRERAFEGERRRERSREKDRARIR